MATGNAKTHCSICGKETSTFNCGGCSLNFCRNDLTIHFEKLSQDLDEIENDHDQFRQKLNDQKDDPKKCQLIQQIDQWEDESINKIKQTAEECRDRLMNYTNKFVIKIENKLNDITKELKQIRQENEFNEIDLEQFKQKLNKLKEELDKPSNISIEQQSTAFINKIFLINNTKWKQKGITIAGGNGQGNQLNQLSYPYGIFIDDDQTIYIADRENHRIVQWKSNATNGQIVAGGYGQGNKTNQLNSPRDVIIDKENNSLIISDQGNRRITRWHRQNNTKNGQIIIENIDCFGLTMDKNGSLYVSDSKKNEVRRWNRGDQNVTIVAGGTGKGNHLNQLNCPTYIFVDEDYSLYVLDRDNHRVMKWIKDAKEGIIVAGGNSQGNSLTQLSYPCGVIVDQLGQIYVADRGNDRVIRWCEGAKQGTIVVGGNGSGYQSNQFNYPAGLSFDQQGNLYVADYGNHRIKKFKINSNEDNCS